MNKNDPAWKLVTGWACYYCGKPVVVGKRDELFMPCRHVPMTIIPTWSDELIQAVEESNA